MSAEGTERDRNEAVRCYEPLAGSDAVAAGLTGRTRTTDDWPLVGLHVSGSHAP